MQRVEGGGKLLPQKQKKMENIKKKKKMEKLNEEREIGTDKVMKKKKRKKKERKREGTKRDKEREIAKEFLSLHPCLSQ